LQGPVLAVALPALPHANRGSLRTRTLLCALALAACSGQDATGPANGPAFATANPGQQICSWGLGDFTNNDPEGLGYLNSGMAADGRYSILQWTAYAPDGTPLGYIVSDPTAGLTTVYGLDSATVRGQLPITVYSSAPGGEPAPAETTFTIVPVDLKLTIDRTRDRVVGITPHFWVMILNGTINGLAVNSGSGISNKESHRFGGGGFKAHPKEWIGGNGNLEVCSKP
jgi:hypothetical protein